MNLRARTNDHAPNPPSTGAKIDSFRTSSGTTGLMELATDARSSTESKEATGIVPRISSSMTSAEGLLAADMAAVVKLTVVVQFQLDSKGSSHGIRKVCNILRYREKCHPDDISCSLNPRPVIPNRIVCKYLVPGGDRSRCKADGAR